MTSRKEKDFEYLCSLLSDALLQQTSACNLFENGNTLINELLTFLAGLPGLHNKTSPIAFQSLPKIVTIIIKKYLKCWCKYSW